MPSKAVTEVYKPPAPNILEPEPFEGHYETWNYSIGYEMDDQGRPAPEGGNTAVFRIFPEGMTEPVFVTKPEKDATFTVNILSGEGELIRAKADGEVEQLPLVQGSEVVIRPGEAYLYRNTGQEDLVLHDVALPAFRPGDDADLTFSYRPDRAPNPGNGYLSCVAKTPEGKMITVDVPTKFYELVGQALVYKSEQSLNPSFTIRPVMPKDIDDLHPIFETWIRDRDTGKLLTQEIAELEEEIRTSINGDGDRKYFVATNSEGKAIGAMGLQSPPHKAIMHFAATERPMEIINAYVSKDERLNGTGITLAKHIEQFAIQDGYTELLVNSGPRYKNTGWAFWTKLYGQPVGTAVGLYGPGGDAMVWRKVLR